MLLTFLLPKYPSNPKISSRCGYLCQPSYLLLILICSGVLASALNLKLAILVDVHNWDHLNVTGQTTVITKKCINNTGITKYAATFLQLTITINLRIHTSINNLTFHNITNIYGAQSLPCLHSIPALLGPTSPGPSPGTALSLHDGIFQLCSTTNRANEFHAINTLS